MVMSKKRIISIVVMAIGLVMLVTGAVFLIIKLNAGPAMADGEYLVSKGEWALEEDESNCIEALDVDVETETTGEETDANAEETDVAESITDGTNCADGTGVIWKFTEIGKGTLTTNNHKNDYDFKWAMEDGRLMMQTNWLYELDNEYDYTLDQGAGVLTLSDGENEYRFVAQTE